MIGSTVWTAFLVNGFCAAVAFAAGSITLSGAFGGIFVGTWIYSFLGFRGFLVLGIFFLLGSLFTRFGYPIKKKKGIAEKQRGRRTYREAVANGLVGCLFAALSFWTGHFLYRVAFVASFATALADTTATELGSLYGRHPTLPFSSKKVSPGMPGAVSLEGTLFGIAASLVLAGASVFLSLVEKSDIFPIVLSATFGFLAEGFLARLPFPVGHGTRNFLNTLLGSAMVILLEWRRYGL